jgi:clathrin heavy chain
MDYINRLTNYDAPDIANIAVGAELYEEALVIFKKHGFNIEAAKVLLEYMHSLERAAELADKVNVPEVWSMLGKAQMKQALVKDAVASYIKADDPSDYIQLIEVTPAADAYAELALFLTMARKKIKEQHIDSTLLYAYAKCANYVALEDFIASPNVAQLQGIGDRCYAEGMYEAAKVLFTSNSNWSRLASCLVHLTEYQAAVDAARKANSARTWKEVNAACVEAAEFRLAQICAMFIIVNPDELESLIAVYEQHGFFDEVIALMESGLNLERAHMGIFTELGILYAKFRPEKLMEHIKLFWSKLNIRKLLSSCEQGHHWEELVFLYTHYDEFDNACSTMMKHPAIAFEHVRFKETIAKVTNTEVYYKAIAFYLEYAPTLLVDMLTVVLVNIDHVRVVLQLRKAKSLALVKDYLLKVQSENIKEVNDALYELYVEDEDHAALAKAIDLFSNFDQIEMAKRCEAHELLQFRRIAAKLYMTNERYAQSIELSKGDQDWTTAIQTTADSGKQELAEELVRFFVHEKNKVSRATDRAHRAAPRRDATACRARDRGDDHLRRAEPVRVWAQRVRSIACVHPPSTP